jgi:large subunit ribosomal protein L24e
MDRIEEIRQKRERAFYKNRMRGNRERQLAEDRRLVEQNQELLRLRDVELARKAAAEGEDDDMSEEMEQLSEMEMSDAEMEVSEEETEKVAVVLKNKKKKSKASN